MHAFACRREGFHAFPKNVIKTWKLVDKRCVSALIQQYQSKFVIKLIRTFINTSACRELIVVNTATWLLNWKNEMRSLQKMFFLQFKHFTPQLKVGGCLMFWCFVHDNKSMPNFQWRCSFET